jgi:O-acetyl-ADP-ribose deacetylase (regulator of RNase III)
MKIITKTGNLMHVTSGHIVHGCNAQGVMGSGVALGIKETYPQAYADYMEIHKDGGLKLGWAYPTIIGEDLVIWNAITQNLYGKGLRMVSYDAIETCFAQINEFIHTDQSSVEGMDHPVDIHIPMIGAARGGGNWEIIREIIEQTMDFPVTLWLPDATVTTR